jgi:hypothetical protein
MMKERLFSSLTQFRAEHAFGPRSLESSILISIYRKKNESSICSLVRQAEQLGMRVVLWALDEPIPGLSPLTVGSGPGPRMELYNRVWESLSSRAVQQLVVADDDVCITTGSLEQLCSASIHCGFGIAQPSHCMTSRHSYSFTRMQCLVLARQTTFVEPGPLFVVNQPWVRKVIPFPRNFGMGWGLWLEWQHLRESGCRLGIVDCVSMKHLSPVADDYSVVLELRRLRRLLRQHQLLKPQDGQRTLATWKVWENRPPWEAGL